MRIGIAGLAFALAAFTQSAGAEPCQLAKVASYDMVPDGEGHVAIALTIADKPELMVVDTGGFFSTLSAAAVSDLKLTPMPMRQALALDIHGNKITSLATAPSIAIGPLPVKDVDFMIAPKQDVYGKNVAGTLAPNILRNFDVDFDFAGMKLNLFSPDHCPGKVVYWTTSGYAAIPFRLDESLHIAFAMTLDGQEVDATLDTGDPVSHLSEPIAYRLFSVGPGTPGTEEYKYPTQGGATASSYRHRFTALSVGGILINNPLLYLLPDEIAAKARAEDMRLADPATVQAHAPQLLLGVKELSALHLYIAYREKTLYVTAANAK